MSQPPPQLGVEPGEDELIGTIDRVIFASDDGEFAIVRLSRPGQAAVVVRGPLGGLHEQEQVAVVGRWVDDPRYGRQVVARWARPELPSTAEGIAAYIATMGIKGVGPKLAERLVQTLGPEALGTIRDDPDALQRVPGIGPKRRAEIADALRPRLLAEEASVFLMGEGVPAALTRRITRHHGGDTLRRLREDPYRLAFEVRGVGFKLADRVARALGVGVDDPRRHAAAVVHALDTLASRGHTAPPLALLAETAAALTGVTEPRALQAGLDAQVLAGRVRRFDEPPAAGLATLARTEERLAVALGEVAAADPARPVADLAARLELAEATLDMAMAPGQRDAIAAALRTPLVVVTGGPGTGKTTIIRGLLAALAPDGPRIALAAPTGRAARRLSEATGEEAKTVHRLLEFEPHGEGRAGRGFRRGRDLPLEADLVIVDEASMLDVRLATSLVEAVPPGGRLALVGDIDQLPSVGPGAVLADLIASGIAPVARLDRIFRQGDRSAIVDRAHAIRAGEPPRGERRADGEFFVVQRSDAERAVETLLEVVCERLPAAFGLDPATDIQVLAPMRRGVLGTHALNEALGAALNPDGRPVRGGFRVGDKVIQTRNNYDLDVFNGDIGHVVGPDGDHVAIRFGERIVRAPQSALEDLEPAWAITVHKSQGSEYPAVALALHGQHHVMLQRNLLYTAVTRARRVCVVVGDQRALARAARNGDPMVRHTRLAGLLTAPEPTP